MGFKFRCSDIYDLGGIAAGVGLVGVGVCLAAADPLRVLVERAGKQRGAYRKAAHQLDSFTDEKPAPRALQDKVRKLEAESTRLDTLTQEKLTAHLAKLGESIQPYERASELILQKSKQYEDVYEAAAAAEMKTFQRK